MDDVFPTRGLSFGQKAEIWKIRAHNRWTRHRWVFVVAACVICRTVNRTVNCIVGFLLACMVIVSDYQKITDLIMRAVVHVLHAVTVWAGHQIHNGSSYAVYLGIFIVINLIWRGIMASERRRELRW